jgi:hypothetical protein
VQQAGGIQKHVSGSGAMSYHKTDQSTTKSVINGNSSPRDITLRVIKLGIMKTVECKKASGNCKNSKAEKDRNCEEGDTQW